MSKFALLNDCPAIDIDTGQEVTLAAGQLIKPMRSSYDNRRLASLAHYFASLKSAADNIPEKTEQIFLENLVKDLSITGCIDVRLLHEFLKMLYGIDSVAFWRLDEKSFQEYKRFALEKLSILTGGKCETH